MSLCAIVLLLLSLTTPSRAADIEPFRDLRLDDAASLQEATRVLEEELKLAARPQTYIVIDLVTQAIHIKGRGVDLHRIPIKNWSLAAGEGMTGVFRVVERPPVVRRKINPAATVEQEPISLADMPIYYELSCTPSLTLEVRPSADEHPLQWTLSTGRIWWRQLKHWSSALFAAQSGSRRPYLQLTLSTEQAQSFAWSLVDGMSLVIRRPPAV